MTAKYTVSRRGMADMLDSGFMAGAMDLVAQMIRNHAEAIAPVGPPSDPHAGRYKASFRTRSHRHGGATHDRAEAIVTNFAPEALYVEFGTEGREPYHTMLRAATEIRI